MVIGFTYIKFESHEALIAFEPRIKSVESFIGCKNVICNQPIRNKSTLYERNDFMEDQLDFFNQDLYYDFVNDITEACGPEVTNFKGILDFGYKSDKCGIYGLQTPPNINGV